MLIDLDKLKKRLTTAVNSNSGLDKALLDMEARMMQSTPIKVINNTKHHFKAYYDNGNAPYLIECTKTTGLNTKVWVNRRLACEGDVMDVKKKYPELRTAKVLTV